jgi:hypothetical protein
MVLVCDSCHKQTPWRELHCPAHWHLRDCYFTFLDHFDEPKLAEQAASLAVLIKATGPGTSRKKRRTLNTQLTKVKQRLTAVREACFFHLDSYVSFRCEFVSHTHSFEQEVGQ